MPPPHAPAPAVERIVGKRTQGSGFQYQLKWVGSEELTWEAASRVKRDLPALVEAFERQPPPPQQQQQEDAPMEDVEPSPAVREQMAALEQMVRAQAQQLAQLKASPTDSAQQSSRFARKEPRAQDLREYDGAAGTKLDEWLQPGGLPAGHTFPYTGDDIVLADDQQGGPYVLQTRRGQGIDAARRNCGVARWVNDPRGAADENGRPRQANCEFVLYTPPGGQQRIASVRTLRPILSGEELLVKYGND